MFPKRVWIAFIILIIAYALVLQESEGLAYASKASRQFKHVVHFCGLLFFTLTGYWGWFSYREKWVARLWITFHAVVFIIVIAGGIVDLFFFIEKLSIRNIFGGIRLFCTSPLPYGLCLILVILKNRTQK